MLRNGRSFREFSSRGGLVNMCATCSLYLLLSNHSFFSLRLAHLSKRSACSVRTRIFQRARELHYFLMAISCNRAPLSCTLRLSLTFHYSRVARQLSHVYSARACFRRLSSVSLSSSRADKANPGRLEEGRCFVRAPFLSFSSSYRSSPRFLNLRHIELSGNVFVRA